MRTETETKIIYVSDDGKRKSYSQSEIENYEKRQLKEYIESDRLFIGHNLII